MQFFRKHRRAAYVPTRERAESLRRRRQAAIAAMERDVVDDAVPIKGKRVAHAIKQVFGRNTILVLEERRAGSLGLLLAILSGHGRRLYRTSGRADSDGARRLRGDRREAGTARPPRCVHHR